MRYKYAFTFVVFILQSDREIFRVGLPTLVVGQRLDSHFFTRREILLVAALS